MDSVLKALRDHFNSLDSCFCKGRMTPKEGTSKSQFKIEFKKNYSEEIWRVKVDDCLIKSQRVNKCDYAFYRNQNNSFILVELKGSDILWGIKQLRSTVEQFKEVVGIVINNNWFAFIVPSRIAPGARTSIQSSKATFIKVYGFRLEIKEDGILRLP